MDNSIFSNQLEVHIRSRPKAELHIHMEGSIRMDTLNRIAQRKKREPFATDFYTFDDFQSFNALFFQLFQLLKDEEDFYEIARDFLLNQAEDNIWYSEMFCMPLPFISGGILPEAFFGGIESGLAEGERISGAKARLICSIPRIMGAQAGEKTLELVERFRTERIIGIDLAGTEKPGDIGQFAEMFRKAKAMGLRRVAHAGEFGPPEQIQAAIDLLGAERIGHGVSAVRSQQLVRRLAQEMIPLEISLTSNCKLKAVSAPECHPVREFFDQGVPIIINTDDPAFFNTTLTEEFLALAEHFRFNETEIEKLAADAFDFAFLEPSERRSLMDFRGKA
jgi:adenosine deaminase